MSQFPEMLELRKLLNLPQSDVAHYLGVRNKQLISQWEIGFRNPPESMRRLVRVLNGMSPNKAKKFLIQMERARSDQRE
jgi:DNA-binding transcriptional regulator YiaG